jgi:3-oxoacyl-[acyl-carrier protein] reductase
MLAVNLRAGFVLGRDLGRHHGAGSRPRDDGGRREGPHALHHVPARGQPAQPAALQRGQGRADDAGEGTGAGAWSARHTGQRDRPGAIPGGGFDAGSAGLDRLAGCTSLRRLGTPEDIAGMALALLSDRFSAYVTGTTVVVDGGIALHNWITPPDL